MTYEELRDKVFAIWHTEGIDCGGRAFRDYDFQSFLMYGAVNCERILFVTREGGGEGGTEDVFSVITVDGVLYRIDYGYRSHEGYSFDYANVAIVQPVERMVTFYETI